MAKESVRFNIPNVHSGSETAAEEYGRHLSLCCAADENDEELRKVSNIRQWPQEDTEMLNAMNDDQLQKFVKDFQEEFKQLEIQNTIFENFLMNNAPEVLTNYDYIKQSVINSPILATQDAWSSTKLPQREGFKSIIFEIGPRINNELYLNLLDRERDVIEESLNKFIQQTNHAKRNIVAEIEEATIRIRELEQYKYFFENIVVVKGVDPITHRIPAENFIGFIKEWYRDKQRVGQQLRVQTNVLRIEYAKAKKKYIEKVETGESILEIDVEVAHNNNRILKRKLEEQLQLVLITRCQMNEAKTKNSTAKRYLLQLEKPRKLLKLAIEETIESTKKLQLEYISVTKRLEAAKNEYNEIKSLVNSNKRVPEIMDYVRVKANLQTLRNVKKVLDRKDNIINMSIKTKNALISNLRRTSRDDKQRWRSAEDTKPKISHSDLISLNTVTSQGLSEYMEFDIFEILNKN